MNVWYEYKVDEEKKDFQYFRKDEQIKSENELDRIYILHTYEKDLRPEEIIDAYKNLQDVERAFRKYKNSFRTSSLFPS